MVPETENPSCKWSLNLVEGAFCSSANEIPFLMTEINWLVTLISLKEQTALLFPILTLPQRPTLSAQFLISCKNLVSHISDRLKGQWSYSRMHEEPQTSFRLNKKDIFPLTSYKRSTSFKLKQYSWHLKHRAVTLHFDELHCGSKGATQ